MASLSIRLTLASAKAELLQAHLEGVALAEDASPELRAVASHVAGQIKKARGTRTQEHKAGDMWRHEREASGEAIYKPMFVRRVAHTTEEGVVLSMSDGQTWMPAELEANGWKRKRR